MFCWLPSLLPPFVLACNRCDCDSYGIVYPDDYITGLPITNTSLVSRDHDLTLDTPPNALGDVLLSLVR